MALDMSQIIKKCYDSTKNALRISGVAGSLSGQITWDTGLGAITHILGPTDQHLALAAGASGKVISLGGAVKLDTEAVSSSSGTLTIDSSLANIFTCTLTENVTTLTFNNAVAGGKYTIVFTQGGAATYTVAFPAAWKWPSGAAPTITTGAGAIDVVTVLYDGTNYLADYAQNFS